MTGRVCVLVLALFINFRPLYACNGYTFKLNSVKDCNGNSVIRTDPNLDVTMDNDCNLLIKGCINMTKPIKTATGSYRFKKPPLPTLEGDVDFCNSLATFDFPAIQQSVSSFGLANKCPYQAQRACAKPNTKIDLSPFKNQLALVSGTTEIKFDVEHDTGKTCVLSNFTFTKNGYTFKLNSVKDCNGNSVIRTDPNLDVTMDNDCNLLIKGCINMTKPDLSLFFLIFLKRIK